jgi:hypothetical protein
MPHDLSVHQVDHILGDIGGQVSDALQAARDADEIHKIADLIRVLPHLFFDEPVHAAVDIIDLVVSGQHLSGGGGVLLDEGVEASA